MKISKTGYRIDLTEEEMESLFIDISEMYERLYVSDSKIKELPGRWLIEKMEGLYPSIEKLRVLLDKSMT